MPKSGSTFFSEIISSLPKVKRARLIPYSGSREQEISESLVIEEGRSAFVAQHHTKYSIGTERLLDRHQITTIVLERNIFDVLVSLRDHILNDDKRYPIESSPLVHFDLRPSNLDVEDLDSYLAHIAVPWYMNFHVGWRSRNAHFCRYEELIDNPLVVVRRALEACGQEYSDAEIKKAIDMARGGKVRMNKGVVGRGKLLPLEAIEKIREILKLIDRISPDPYIKEMLKQSNEFVKES
jgi:hypothetical protein